MPSRSHRGISLDSLLLGIVAVPYLFSRFVPGLDVPWHTLFASAVAHGDDPGFFLGYLHVDFRLTTYASLYALIDALSIVLTTETAVRVLMAASAVAWALAARSMLRAAGKDERCALLVAPLFFSAVHSYGFLAFNLALPAVFFGWAGVTRWLTNEHRKSLFLAIVAGAFVALTHAVAAMIFVAGALVLAALVPGRTRSRWVALIAAVATAPAIWALVSMGADDGGAVPDFIREASALERLMAQPYSSPWVSLRELPANALAYGAAVFSVVFVVGGWLLLAPRSRSAGGGDARGGVVRPLAWLATLAVLGYLVTPFSFDWPRVMVAAQPRLAPVVVGLVTIAVAPVALRRWQHAAVMTLFVAALASISFDFSRFGAEVDDFEEVLAAAERGTLTLALIEQPLAPDRGPAGPFRHFGAYIAAAKGGFVSNAPVWATTQPWVPVRVVKPRPASPPPGYPRNYRPSRHASWKQLLVFDDDPANPFDYTSQVSGAELLAQSGRWRLYRLPGTEGD